MLRAVANCCCAFYIYVCKLLKMLLVMKKYECSIAQLYAMTAVLIGYCWRQ